MQGKDQSKEVQRKRRKGDSEGLWKAHPYFLWILELGCLDLALGIEVTEDAKGYDTWGNTGFFCQRAGSGEDSLIFLQDSFSWFLLIQTGLNTVLPPLYLCPGYSPSLEHHSSSFFFLPNPRWLIRQGPKEGPHVSRAFPTVPGPPPCQAQPCTVCGQQEQEEWCSWHVL